jgi:hypothetical protein
MPIRAKAKPAAASSVTLRGPGGATKEIGTGFAWDLFLFAPFFGLPLFLRRLPHWGAAILGLWVVDLLLGRLVTGRAGSIAQAALLAVFLAVQCWLGLKGNDMTVKAYLGRGWRLKT